MKRTKPRIKSILRLFLLSVFLYVLIQESPIRSRRESYLGSGYRTFTAYNFGTISILPTLEGFPSPLVASRLQWIGSPPYHSLIILIVELKENCVTNSILFRSQENGSMVKVTCDLQANPVIDSFFISKNPNKVIFRDLKNHHLYVSTDAGNSCYSTGDIKFTPNVIQLSNHNEDCLFAIDHSSNNLYVSTQLAISNSWENLSTGVEAAYWTRLEDELEFDDPTAIYFTKLNTQSGNYEVKKAVSPYQNLSTCEFCQRIGEVTNFKLAYEYIFVTKNVANKSTLFVSYKRQFFVQAKFIPAMDGDEQYSVVDASQGQVLLAVLNDDATANLYISDEWGTNYSLSLRNIITNNFQWNSGIESFDFYKVEGTNWTYIANVAVFNSYHFNQTTVISYNKGANWSPVIAPTVDRDMSPVECYYPDCSLHFDMHNSGIVSKESAVGMIIARGTLVKNFVKSVGLYLSHDGGFSWQKLTDTNETDATYLFSFLDNGSTILVTNISKYAKEFMISCDTGYSWQNFTISNCTNGGDNIELYTEMSGAASLATLYGYSAFPYASYVVFNLDMSKLNLMECKDDLDYIHWMPSNGRIGNRCVLGKKFTYNKRKLGHWCRNKPNYWIPSGPSSCTCTIEDFGCDVGFEHIDFNSPCTPVDGYPFNHTVSNYSLYGYRRISGDECTTSQFYNKLVQPFRSSIKNGPICASISGPGFALVDNNVEFDVNVSPMMLSGTIYRWIITNKSDGTVLRNCTMNETRFFQAFNRTGAYKVMTQGLNPQSHNEMFNATTYITIGAICYSFQLMATPLIVAVNQSVTLSVTKGLNIENYLYFFSFGDSQQSNKTVKDSVVHSYSVSGSYQASVTVQGFSTSVCLETVVIVQDRIGEVCVNSYVKSLNVTYIATIDCGDSLNHTYGTIHFTWDFNNGKIFTTSLNTITTTYQSIGTYNFSVFVSNNVSQKNYTGNISVDTEHSIVNVQTSITGPRFALVNSTVMFSVSINMQAICNFSHAWTIKCQETDQVYVSKNVNELVINFTKPDTCKVLASTNCNGYMLSSSHIISIEKKICYIKVDFPPVVEVARQTAIFIHLYGIHNDSYKEAVNISIASDTQFNILRYIKSPLSVEAHLSYSVNDIYDVNIIASNHFSNISTSLTVEVVRTNTTLLLQFSVVALSQANVSYETTSWRKQFSDVIDTSLTNESNLPNWQLIVIAGNVRNFLEMFVDVLPMWSNLTALANATMIAEQLVDVLNSNYTFSLPNSSLSISVSNTIILGLPQEPKCPAKKILSKAKRDDNNSLKLGIVIGIPVLIAFVISIVVGIIFYKRKFCQSRKQYGRLIQPNQASVFINDEEDAGVDRTNDILMDDILPEQVTNYEAVTENL